MNPKKLFFTARLAILSLLLIAVVPAVGRSATFVVNSPADVAGLAGNCVSGVGQCTLRSAIQAANASLAVADTITLPAGTYVLSLLGAGEQAAATGDLDVTLAGGPLTINGAGAATTIIDGNNTDRIFETIGAATLTISDVTLRNGNPGAAANGGAINTAGGSILTLNNVTITANTSGLEGGAINIGANAASRTTMNTVTISNNSSGVGGDIIANGAGATLAITNGTINNNNETAISNKLGSTLTLTNVTVSGNVTTGGGGAIDSLGTATLQNVTVNLNTGAVGAGNAGGIRNNAGTLNIGNTIVTNNTPSNCAGNALASLGGNFTSDVSCTGLTAAGDITNTPLQLAPLANNGGALQTHALLAGSPAIDTGTAAGCPATDARGIARPVDGNIPLDGVAICDKGAFEFRPQKITVTPVSPFNFGTVSSGTPLDHVVTLGNAGDGALVIGPLAVTDPLAAPFSIPAAFDACSNKTLPLAGSCTFIARFVPTTALLATDTFNIPSNDPAAPAVAFALSGTGTGSVPTGTVNNPPTNPVLVSPTNGQTGVPTTVTFTWNKSVDPDGDALTYHFMYGTDPTLAVSQTVDVASAKIAGLLFAGLGSMGGGFIMIGFVAGDGSRRSRIMMLAIIALISIGALFTGCGGDGGGTPSPAASTTVSTTVNSLAANTTYYWKVVADDGKGGLASSATFSFKTQ